MNKFYLVLCLSFVVIFANPSCTKIDTTTLGGDLIPVIDNVNTFETFLDVITNLEALPDSTRILSTTGTADDHAFGRINGDLSFGATTADIYMAIGTNSTSPIMPFGPKDSIMAIDSVVLQLAYTGQFGDSTSVAQIQVREINPAVKFDYPVNKDTIIVGYKIDTLNSANGNGFGTTAALGPVHNQDFSRFKYQYTLRRSSSDTEVVSNVMRIPLSNTLGQRLAGYDTVGATAPFRSDSLFRTYFRGMQIRATSISSALGGAIAYFNLNSTNTKLYVYYRKKKVGGTAGEVDTTRYSFNLSTAISANLVERNPSGTPYASVLANANPNDPELYIQSSPGSFASVKIPGLAALQNCVVHRAELSFERLPGINDNVFTSPPLLFLDIIDSANAMRKAVVPNDFSYDIQGASGFSYNLTYFGGFLQNNRYWFNLSRYVQGIVTRKEKNFTFRVYAPFTTEPYMPQFLTQRQLQLSTKIAFGRVVLAGGSHPDQAKKVKLRIIYSKI